MFSFTRYFYAKYEKKSHGSIDFQIWFNKWFKVSNGNNRCIIVASLSTLK